jgi:HEAT repeat protein
MVRRSAIIALEKIDPGAPARMVPSLLQKATNVDSSVRCSAIIALGYISAEPDRIVPVVINALHDPDPRTRYFAIGALGELGPNAKAALPTLTELLNTSSNETLRAQVASALKAINPEAAVNAEVKKPSP